MVNRNERALLVRRHKGLRFIGLSALLIAAFLATIGVHTGLIAPFAIIGAVFTWRASYWQGWLDATRAES